MDIPAAKILDIARENTNYAEEDFDVGVGYIMHEGIFYTSGIPSHYYVVMLKGTSDVVPPLFKGKEGTYYWQDVNDPDADSVIKTVMRKIRKEMGI